MTDGFFIKRVIGGEECYFPADERTAKRVSKTAEGEIVTVSILDDKMARDPVEHNQFFAIIDKCILSIDHETKVYNICGNKDMEIAREAFVQWLKKQVGFVVYRQTYNPITRKVEEVAYPDSISFLDCPEHKARAFRTACYAVLCQLFNCSRADLFDGTFGRY